MDLNRYLDLYLSETRENLRSLSRAFLELETTGGAEALEEAFRAAHTLKGMAATMAFRRVSEVAHELEDRLDDVRAGRRAIDGELIDELLATADRLEREVGAAVGQDVDVAVEAGAAGDRDVAGAAAAAADAGPGVGPGVEASEAPDAPASTAAAPEGTGMVVHVTLRHDVALPAARALLVRQRVGEVGVVLGSDPPEFGDAFDGRFSLFLADGADREAVRAAVAAAGEVERVAFGAVRAAGAGAGRAESAAEASVRAGARARARHVRVDQRHLDELADGIGEFGIVWGRIKQLVAARGAHELATLAERADRLLEELQDTALALRMVPVAEVFDRFPRVVRDAARVLGKEVDVRLEGREIEVDRSILDELAEPLVHLLRNAVDHGIEAPAVRRAAGKPERGRLLLHASRDRSGIVIRIEDDGGGVDRQAVLGRARELGLLAADASADVSEDELLRLLSHPGFSTKAAVTEVSGRGVGLDVVVDRVRSLGGVVALRTAAGQGTTIVLRLPITLAVAQALRIRVGGEDYAIPLTHVAEAVELTEDMVARVRGREVLWIRGEAVPLVRLRSVLQTPGAGRDTAAVVTEAGDRRRALAVDALVGREQIVVKGFDAAAGTLPIFSGVTLLGDGRPALVVDPMSVL